MVSAYKFFYIVFLFIWFSFCSRLNVEHQSLMLGLFFLLFDAGFLLLVHALCFYIVATLYPLWMREKDENKRMKKLGICVITYANIFRKRSYLSVDYTISII